MTTLAEDALENMIHGQLRPSGVIEERTLNSFRRLPREGFVPEGFESVAYSDTLIPLGNADTMLTPLIEGKCLQALDVKGNETALVVGTGSGYMSALIADQAQQVFSIDTREDLTERATQLYKERHIFNITLSTIDGQGGYADHAPYEVIFVSGGLPYLPTPFKPMLNIGGRLIAFLGSPGSLVATMVTRTMNNDWSIETLFETDIPMLTHDLPSDSFNF